MLMDVMKIVVKLSIIKLMDLVMFDVTISFDGWCYWQEQLTIMDVGAGADKSLIWLFGHNLKQNKKLRMVHIYHIFLVW